MTLKRIRQSAKRWLAIVLAILSIVVGVLWADSYRVRVGKDRFFNTPRSICGVSFWADGSQSWFDVPGVELSCSWDEKDEFVTFQTWEGDMGVRYTVMWPIGPEIELVLFSHFGIVYQQFDTSSKWFDEIRNLYNHGDCRVRELSVPFWFLFLLTSIYPVIFFIRGPFRRHRRKKKGHCIDCGYDLRASMETCPECGAGISTTAETYTAS